MNIDDIIMILQRVKNCDKALNNLYMARDNCIFSEALLGVEQKKWLDHVKKLICEAIQIIEDVEDKGG